MKSSYLIIIFALFATFMTAPSTAEGFRDHEMHEFVLRHDGKARNLSNYRIGRRSCKTCTMSWHKLTEDTELTGITLEELAKIVGINQRSAYLETSVKDGTVLFLHIAY